MSKNKHVFRVHPAIGLARVGNSEEFYLGPETIAGMPLDGNDKTTGGLPIKAGTEMQTITSNDLRDSDGAFKRQAARFKIYYYPAEKCEIYPNGGGKELKINDKIDGKRVKDIIWTVHLANKKANAYVLENPNLSQKESIIDGYANGALPPLRNAFFGDDPSNANRVRSLTIDPGPRCIKGSDTEAIKFDRATVASFCDSDEIIPLHSYPKSYPEDSFSQLYSPAGNIDTLGEIQTDTSGRLLVLAGYGKACSWYNSDGKPFPLNGDVDNDGWFDDTSDGPVSAVILFDDGSNQQVHGAWAVATDPGYAPQTLNTVSLWDDMYNSWILQLKLQPEIFSNRYNRDYKPFFKDHLQPYFRSAALQQWNTNLPDQAQRAHQAVGAIEAKDKPSKTIMAGLAYIRNPNNPPESYVGAPFMPLSLGDSGKSFLSSTETQYFFLEQWNNGNYEKKDDGLGAGEKLDRAILSNCLGGRFSPGIDMTFIIRQSDLYIKDWQTSGSGPFRINTKSLNYKNAQSTQPFLGEGYVPLHTGATGLEPGDTSKFMANPWHTDYNSCATHTTDPDLLNSTTLYWSWPAQRPVAIYAAKDVINGELGPQRFSVRGKGTESNKLQNEGRFQERIDMVKKWHQIGVVIQGSAIDGDVTYSPDYYLEVESQLDKPEVTPWPFNADE